VELLCHDDFVQQVSGDSPDGSRPQQYCQVPEADRRSRPVPHLSDPSRTEG